MMEVIGRISLPQRDLSAARIATVLNILAAEYHTTFPVLLRKFNRISGNWKYLNRVNRRDRKFEWR